MFEIISSKNISGALEKSERQYLCGNLKKEQALKEIFDGNVEVGITSYKTGKTESPHFHRTCSEYQYVISGRTKFLDLDTNEEFEFKEGDFFVIRPDTRYYQKSLSGCKILFFKYPGGNDKVTTDLTKEQREWGENYNV